MKMLTRAVCISLWQLLSPWRRRRVGGGACGERGPRLSRGVLAQIAVVSQSVFPWHCLPGAAGAPAIVLLWAVRFCSWLCPSELLKNIGGL